jgi:hypothetical protein
MTLTDEQFEELLEKLKMFTLVRTEEGEYVFKYNGWAVADETVALEISRPLNEERIIVFITKEHRKRLKDLQNEKIKTIFDNFLQIK